MIKRSVYTAPIMFQGFLMTCGTTLALDTETYDPQEREGGALNYIYLEIEGFSLCDGKQACYVHLKGNKYKDKLLAQLGFFLEERAELVIMHNAPFDMSVLYKYGIKDYTVACTKTASFLLDENRPSTGLKDLAGSILNVPKSRIISYEDAASQSFATFCKYAINDAVWTYQLYQRFSTDLIKQGLGHVFQDVEMPFQTALRDLRINGALVDRETAREMRYETQHLHCRLEDEMFRYVYTELWGRNPEEYWGNWYFKITPRSRVVSMEQHINFCSTDQMIRIIESLGIKITERTKKKNKSIGKAFKDRIKGTHSFLDLWLKYIKAEKLLSSFLNPFEEHVNDDGRIRCNFHNCTAVTGRLSCSNPNLEQLPQNNDIANIRNLFVSSPNNVLIVADYSGQELRVLAEESQDPVLRGAYLKEPNDDLHQITADATGNTRTDAKRINFGIPYGKQAYGFSKDFRCSVQEAQKFLDAYFDKYVRVHTRIEQCKRAVFKNGYIKNMSGRRRRFPGIKGMSKWGRERCYRQAFNFLIQSFSADMMKIAAGRAVCNPNLKLVNLIHDELVVECKESYAKECVNYVREVMVNAVKLSVPLKVDIHLVKRYGDVEK